MWLNRKIGGGGGEFNLHPQVKPTGMLGLRHWHVFFSFSIGMVKNVKKKKNELAWNRHYMELFRKLHKVNNKDLTVENVTVYITYVDSPGKWDNPSIKEVLHKLPKVRNIE